MTKSTKTLVIIGVIVLLVLIAIGVYASKSTSPALPKTAPPLPGQSSSTNWLDIIGGFLKKFSKSSTSTTAYIQVTPIDDQGCDANGYDAIGVKCGGY